MRWLVVIVLLSACNRALDTPIDQVTCSMFTDEPSCLAAGCEPAASCGCPGEPSFAGCTEKTETHPDSCTTGCATPTSSCESITSADACTARSDCYALLTFHSPCNNVKCDSAFVSCHQGPPACGAPLCEVPDGSSCDANDEVVAVDGTCGGGCVDRSKCPPAE